MSFINRVRKLVNNKDFSKDFAVVLIGINILIFLSFYYDFLSDDAFIIFRYVRNFISGLGPVFNRGELVEGFSSPLWLLLLSLFAKTGIDIVLAGRYLGLLFSCLQLILFYIFLKKIKLNQPSRGAAFIYLSLSNIIAVWSLGGLETTMYSFLIFVNFFILVTTSMWKKKNLIVYFVFNYLLFLTRIEGLFIPLVSFIYFIYLSKKHKFDIRESMMYYFLPLFGSIIITFIIRLFLYHQLLPNTFYAKVGAGFSLYWRGLVYAVGFFWDYYYVLLFLILAFFSLFLRKEPLVISLLFILSIITEVIIVGGDGLAMYRFMLPVWPYLAILVAYLLDYLIEKCKLNKLTTIVNIIFVSVLFYKQLIPPGSGYQYGLYLEQKQYEIPRWIKVGKWLKTHALSGESVAMAPIGASGYYSGLKVYDMLGLVDPYISHLKVSLGKGWAGHEKHDGQYILSKKPTYLLLGNIQVLDRHLDKNDPNFCHSAISSIREREDDFFTGNLWKFYEKKIDYIGDGYYLHYLKLKQ